MPVSYRVRCWRIWRNRDPRSGGYNYRIGTYDVTASQYVEFLNAKDSSGSNPLGLYNSNMSNVAVGGINFTAGNANGSKYSVISGRGNHPVNYVTWYDAFRFANWLNNGQGSGDTESGAYTLLGGTPTPSNGLSITRNAGATVFLPSEDEWYKAAYYDPGSSSYFDYPTSSNTQPNCERSHRRTQPCELRLCRGQSHRRRCVHRNDEPLRRVRHGRQRLSMERRRQYGLVLGRAWRFVEQRLDAPWRASSTASPLIRRTGTTDIGFRVASVPEPSTGVLGVIACGLMWCWRKRFK